MAAKEKIADESMIDTEVSGSENEDEKQKSTVDMTEHSPARSTSPVGCAMVTVSEEAGPTLSASTVSATVTSEGRRVTPMVTEQLHDSSVVGVTNIAGSEEVKLDGKNTERKALADLFHNRLKVPGSELKYIPPLCEMEDEWGNSPQRQLCFTQRNGNAH